MSYGALNDAKEILKTLLTLDDKFKAVEKRLEKLDDCCEDLSRKVTQCAEAVSKVPDKIKLAVQSLQIEMLKQQNVAQAAALPAPTPDLPSGASKPRRKRSSRTSK